MIRGGCLALGFIELHARNFLTHLLVPAGCACTLGIGQFLTICGNYVRTTHNLTFSSPHSPCRVLCIVSNGVAAAQAKDLQA